MEDNKIFHVLDLVKELAAGKEICLKQHAIKYNVSERTMQRYINNIESFFGKDGESVLQKVGRGCFSAISAEFFSKNIVADITSKLELERFSDIVHIVNPGFFEQLPIDHQKSLKKLRKELSSIYFIKENPFEEFMEFETLDVLKKAIKGKRYCDIEYEADRYERFENAKPLRIIFAEGNWYLATMTNAEINNGFKFLRISFIKNVTLQSNTFYNDPSAEDFIKTFQTLFSSYKKPYFDVVVSVSPQVDRFFKAKKFLTNQHNIGTREDGRFEIRYQINNYMEIFRLAQQWLPHLRIESPKELKDEFDKLVKSYLDIDK